MAVQVTAGIGQKKITIETGEIARQAGGSVVVRCGDTIVFSAATAASKSKPGFDFFPLTIDYREKFYSSGRIPGGFLRREGRPADRETLVSRLADRPMRPLFPDGFNNETQVFMYTLSYDGENEPDVLAVNTASAALTISDVPFLGPVGAVRMGIVDGALVVNPTREERKKSAMDVVVAGTSTAITMVEGEAHEVTEARLVEALELAHSEIKKLCAAQLELAAKAPNEKMGFEPAVRETAVHEQIREKFSAEIKTAVCIPEKHQRAGALSEIKSKIVKALTTDENRAALEGTIKSAYDDVEQMVVRHMIVTEGRRADGRGLAEVRPISIRTGVLPRAHGSALFTRGETQVLVAVTLGTGQDEQLIDNIEGKSDKDYYFHYNFPPFSVGEVKFQPGPGRREIGHGMLAERAVGFCLPDKEKFPYTVRVVSEVMESNGSSSMASVCGGTLALMDAGVQIKAPVAGVAMGLVAEGDKTAIITDILGLEDALGDMDFKVAGTRKGITAIQMDIKTVGLSMQIMKDALAQANGARMHILDQMAAALPKPKDDISLYAPRMIIVKVPSDMVGAVIGPGGKIIRSITEASNSQIDIEDDGTVKIFAANLEDAQKAKTMVENIVQPAEIGKTFIGKVTRIVDFGAFVQISPGTEGLVHISHMAPHRIDRVSDVVSEGDEILVKVIDVDQRTKKIRLSHKEALEDEKAGKKK
ncbi:MAG: polyribonucleotide nucleotidyltransferase [Nitrospinae bacterium]|nr:polyribonucleotide nucleotidyltransferase [Nitrospinota bacterium]